MCVTVHYTHLASLSNKKIIIIIVSLDWKANAKSGKIRKVESRCHLSILKSPLDNVDFLRDASVIVPRLNAQTRSQMQSDRNNNSNETLAREEEEEEFKVHSTSISVCRRHFRANGREGGGRRKDVLHRDATWNFTRRARYGRWIPFLPRKWYRVYERCTVTFSFFLKGHQLG